MTRVWHWGVEIREYRDSHSRATWRLNRWRRCLGNSNRQQLVNQPQMFQQSLEMQRQQTVSSSDGKTLANIGAAQAAKMSHDARDFQTKAFTNM